MSLPVHCYSVAVRPGSFSQMFCDARQFEMRGGSVESRIKSKLHQLKPQDLRQGSLTLSVSVSVSVK